jgi:ribosome biogenesis GTPase
MIDKDELCGCFPEFEKYLGECQFSSCSHTCEKGCRVLRALGEGEIEKTRHQSYVAMYNEVKDIKPWQVKK